MPDEVKNAIEQNAQGPSSARGDSGEGRQHPLPDQIAADKYLAADQALKRNHGGIRTARDMLGHANLWTTNLYSHVAVDDEVPPDPFAFAVVGVPTAPAAATC